jgi:hypothetical protein
VKSLGPGAGVDLGQAAHPKATLRDPRPWREHVKSRAATASAVLANAQTCAPSP